ncbi:MAG: AraC family transcriptional regulator [Muribaculaceae bacterium]|nr:AraC family transcriptional regulator [Muribaculaceae bacterium]
MGRRIYILMAVVLWTCLAEGKVDIQRMYDKYRHLSMSQLADMGNEYMTRQSNDSALAVFTIMVSRVNDMSSDEDKNYGVTAYNSIGVIHFLQANYAAAYSNFLNSIQLLDIPDSPGYQNIAAIYHYYGDTARANACLRRVVDYAVNEGHWEHAMVSLMNLITTNLNMEGSYDLEPYRRPLEQLLKNIPSSEAEDIPYLMMFCQAMLQASKGQHQEAIDDLKKSVDMAGSMVIPPRDIYGSYSCIAREFLTIGETDSAIHYIGLAEQLARDNNFQELVIESYKNLSYLYGRSGLTDKQREYHYRHLELSDSILNFREFGHIRDLELAHEVNHFEKRLTQMMLEERLRRNTLWLVSVALVIVIGLVFFLICQNKRLKEKNRELFNKNIEDMKRIATMLDLQSAQSSTHDRNEIPDNNGENNENVSHSEIVTEDSGISRVKYEASKLTDQAKDEILEKVYRVMNDSKYFCREGFSLKDMAEYCGSNVTYVSQVINEKIGKTFTQILNEARVNEARKRFVDFETYGHLTIEAIVADLGFKSRSTFSKTFKRITGLTPTEFQKIARETQASDETD